MPPKLVSHPRDTPGGTRDAGAKRPSRNRAAFSDAENISTGKLTAQVNQLIIGLGDVFSKLNLRAVDWMKQWDTKGSGGLSRSDFREKIKVLELGATAETVDQLFDKLDGNSNGILELDELKAGLRTLLRAVRGPLVATPTTGGSQPSSARRPTVKTSNGSSSDPSRRASSAPRGGRARAAKDDAEKVGRQKMVQRQNQRAEKETERLDEIKKQQPLVVKLGEALLKKNIRAVDWLRSWDTNGDGMIQKEEFYEHVAGLGIQADKEEMDALFSTLDEVGCSPSHGPQPITGCSPPHGLQPITGRSPSHPAC